MILSPVTPPALSVLTQNIRQQRPDTAPGEADHWADRATVLVDLLQQADVDVLGTQEVLPSQIPVLDEALGHSHLRLGHGRDGGGRGEHNLLLLRRERFELLDWDQFWVSEQPEHIGSVGWDAHCPRIAVWARVADRAGGREMVFAVTHLDHAGQLAREKGAGVIAQRLREEADGVPVALIGDFNADSGDSTPWRILRDAGYDDARESAAQIHGEDIGTFPDYGPLTGEGPRIDWILTRDFEVGAYAAHAHQLDGAFASDHAAVMAQLTPA